MKCNAVRDTIIRHWTEGIPLDDTSLVHLALCDECKALWEALLNYDEDINRHEPLLTAEESYRQVLQKLEGGTLWEMPGRRTVSIRRLLKPAAATAAAIIIGIFVGGNLMDVQDEPVVQIQRADLLQSYANEIYLEETVNPKLITYLDEVENGRKKGREDE